MKREELLSRARRELWAAWALSGEEMGSQAADTLYGLGMLVEPGCAAELVRLRKRVAALESELSTLTAQGDTLRTAQAGSPVRVPLEGEHYQHVHHSYRIPHDLPSIGGVQ